MSINATVVRMSNGGWRFTWPVGTSPYSIWLDGVLLDTVDDEEYESVLPGYDDAPPALEILDDGDTAENALYPPYLQLQWRGLANAAGYVIQQDENGTWVDVQTVQETGKGYYLWKSPPQDDESSLSFRVLAVDLRGNEGSPISFSMEMCRNPAPPDVSLSLSSDGNVVVSEA